MSRKVVWGRQPLSTGFIEQGARGQLQRFISIHDPVADPFHFPRNTLSSADHRALRAAAMQIREEIAHITAA